MKSNLARAIHMRQQDRLSHLDALISVNNGADVIVLRQQHVSFKDDVWGLGGSCLLKKARGMLVRDCSYSLNLL